MALFLKTECACFLYFFPSLQSLSGHISPVESVAFDSAEVLILGGASSGVIKQWDLQEAKSKLFATLKDLHS